MGFTRRIFQLMTVSLLATAMLPMAQAPAQAATTGVTFHFYGALNCPPCMAFKRNYLASVREQGEAHGFAVAENIIPRLQDTGNEGVFGPADPILREAGKQLPSYYPPIFFVTSGDEVITAYLGDWRSALDDAITAAKS